MINWHHEPAAAALIAQLNAQNTALVNRVSIPADFSEYVGTDAKARRAFNLLERHRTRAIERALGCSFDEAIVDCSRRDEILAILAAAPTVSQAVAEAL